MTVVAKNLARSRLGRAFVAVRDNEAAAEIMGINPFTTKLRAFFLGCLIAGVAGWMRVLYDGCVRPDIYPLMNSIWLLGIIIIGGMGIRPDRNLKVNFTIPYDVTGMSIVAHKEHAAGFDSLEDFNRPHVAISVRLGSTAVAAAKKFMPKAKLRKFDDESQAYQELINGKAHAVVGSAPMPTFQALKYSEKLFLPLKGTFTKEPIGFALRKGDFDTLNFFNKLIRS